MRRAGAAGARGCGSAQPGGQELRGGAGGAGPRGAAGGARVESCRAAGACRRAAWRARQPAGTFTLLLCMRSADAMHGVATGLVCCTCAWRRGHALCDLMAIRASGPRGSPRYIHVCMLQQSWSRQPVGMLACPMGHAAARRGQRQRGSARRRWQLCARCCGTRRR